MVIGYWQWNYWQWNVFAVREMFDLSPIPGCGLAWGPACYTVELWALPSG